MINKSDSLRREQEIDRPRAPTSNDRRIRTKKAAENAIRLVDEIIASNGSEFQLEQNELFAAMQACAYRATLKNGRHGSTPCERTRWAKRWKIVRDFIVEENMGLVFAMMTRFRIHSAEWDELRSEALLALLRSVEGFDPTRGVRFSTYACNAILRGLIQAERRAAKRRVRFPMEYDVSFERPGPSEDRWSELYVDRLHRALNSDKVELTERESEILGWRFPLGGGDAMTLEAIGDTIGLSKERVRQIQKSALTKIRAVLEADPALQ